MTDEIKAETVPIPRYLIENILKKIDDRWTPEEVALMKIRSILADQLHYADLDARRRVENTNEQV